VRRNARHCCFQQIATLSLNLVDRQLGRLSELDTSALLISLEAWLKQLAKE
jgi:hypothetical protein